MNVWILLRAEWDRVLGIVLIAAGGLALLFGYLGVAGSVLVAQQLAYVVSGGLGGLFLGSVGVGLLVSADLHDEWRKLDRIEGAIRSTAAGADEATASPSPPLDGPAGRGSAGRAVGAGPTALPPRPAHHQAVSATSLDWSGDRLRSGLSAMSAGVGVALVGLAWAWSRTADAADVPTGAPWLAVGAGAVAAGLLAVAGYPLWLRLHLAQRKRRLLRSWLLQSAVDELNCDRSAPRAADDRYAVADGLSRYHLVGCPTLSGVGSRTVTLADLDARLEPCRICQPQ